MVKTYIGCGGGQATVANETSYLRLGGNVTKNTTEVNRVDTIFRSAGTLSNLYVRVTVNSIPTAASTVRTRKNAANGGQSVSVGISATGEFTDGSGTDTVAAGDKFNYQFVPGAATGTLTMVLLSVIFDATTDTVTRTIAADNNQRTTASTTWYVPLNGYAGGLLTAETNTKIRMREAGTLKNAAVLVSAARAVASTVKSRKNGADGTLSVSLTGATTGVFEDTTHSDTVTAGEDWNWSVTTGTGVDTLTIQSIAADFVSTAGNGMISLSNCFAPIAYPDAATGFSQVAGDLKNIATESLVKQDCRIAGDYSELTCLVTQNAVTSASSIVLRKNGVDTALVCSITASTTGVFSDSTHTVTLVATDEINYSIVVPSVAGSVTVTITNISMFTFVTGLTRISLSNVYKYNIIGRISLSRIYKYHVLGRISLSRIYKYNTLQRVGQPSSILFDGVDDFISCTNDATLWSQGLTKFSFSFWIYPTAMGGGTTRTMVAHGTLGHRFSCFLRSAATSATFLMANAANSATFEATVTTLSTGMWHHIIAVYDSTLGSANLKIYHDTNLGSTTANLTETVNNSAVLKLSDDTTDFQGNMKDFRWWTTKALNSTEISDVFNNSSAAPTPNFWLQMREGTGNPEDFITAATGAKVGTLTNGPTWDTTAPDVLNTPQKTLKYNLLARVSLARTYLWNVIAGLTRISLSRVYKYNVLSRISLSRIYKYHVLSRISLSRIYKYHVLGRISLSRIYKYNVIGRISLARIYKYHVQKRVSLSRIYKYHVLGRVSLSRIYKYHVAVRVSLSRIYKYHVLGRISLSRIYKYHVARRVSLSRIYKYNIIGRISLSRIYKYHVQARVSLARIYKYHVLGRISLARIYKYHVTRRISLSRIYKYHVAVRVSLSRIYKYHIATRVSLARVYKYNIIGRISLARVYLWNVAVAGLTRITLTRVYKYNVQQRISVARIYKWNLVTRVSLARLYKYHIQGRVSLQKIYKYNVLQRISQARIYKYHVLARVSLARVYKYHILGRISLARIYKYNVIARVSLARVYKWNVLVIGLTRISLVRVYKYNVATRVSLTRIYKYNVLNRISLSRIYKYHVLARVSLSRIYKYNVLAALARISKQQIYKYNVIARLSKSSRLKWNIATLAVTQVGKIREWIYAKYQEINPPK